MLYDSPTALNAWEYTENQAVQATASEMYPYKTIKRVKRTHKFAKLSAANSYQWQNTSEVVPEFINGLSKGSTGVRVDGTNMGSSEVMGTLIVRHLITFRYIRNSLNPGTPPPSREQIFAEADRLEQEHLQQQEATMEEEEEEEPETISK